MAFPTPSTPEQAESSPRLPSPDALVDEVSAARDALVSSVAELRGQLAPGPLAARAGRAVGGWFTKPDGGVRPERIAIAGAVVLGLVALTALSRRRR